MEAMRKAWTDGRLDDLNHRVDELGRRMDEGFNSVNTRIDTLQRTMIQIGGLTIAALIGLIATQL